MVVIIALQAKLIVDDKLILRRKWKAQLAQRSNPLVQVTKKAIPEFFAGAADDSGATF